MKKAVDKLKGFTLIEVLVVIALIAILAAITIIAINPQENFNDAEDRERQSDVSELASAVNQYLIDDESHSLGDFVNTAGTPDALTDYACSTTAPFVENSTNSADAVGATTTTNDEINFSPLLVTNGGTLTEIPVDPDGAEYKVCVLNGTRVVFGTFATNENPPGYTYAAN